jgi:hypothetical protein
LQGIELGQRIPASWVKNASAPTHGATLPQATATSSKSVTLRDLANQVHAGYPSSGLASSGSSVNVAKWRGMSVGRRVSAIEFSARSICNVITSTLDNTVAMAAKPCR